MGTLAILDAEELFTFPEAAPMRGSDMGSIEPLNRASLFCANETVVSLAGGAADVTIDARGCTVVPGLVDPHTHLPFFGWRADEDAARLAGLRYETLHRQEGGIYRSARLLADASDDDVLRFSEKLASAMLRHGTTTFETKSGYGLSVDGELRQLRLARALAERVPQTVVTTCLAAHAVPRDKSEGEWIGEVASVLLPRSAAEGLASACDIYVESIAFQLEHAARLSRVSEELGLRMRVHADQLEDGQSAAFAARWGLASADHLNHTSADAVGDLAASNTAAVLLPGATFTLRQNKKPPARNLIEEGAIVALGTDLNPGTSPLHSMLFVIALACRVYGFRPREALAAATVNAAYVLDLHETIGRLAPGCRADAVVLDVPSFDEVPYRPDHDPVLAVVCGGEVAFVSSAGEERVKRA
jgi:imidazolonepropionase